jgi:5'-nucleotidase
LDQFGRAYFWLTGDFVRHDTKEGSDLQALEQGYASVVPTQFDMTAYNVMAHFNDWSL